MKKITLVLLFLYCVSGLVSAQDAYLETAYVNCFLDYASKNGIDLNVEFNRFENYLIEEGVLINNSGESYYNVFNRIIDAEGIDFEIEYSWFDTLNLHRGQSDIGLEMPDCMENLYRLRDTYPYRQSKLYMFQNAIFEIFTSEKNIDIKAISEEICKILTPGDFERDYYRFNALLWIAGMYEIDTGLSRKLPPIPKQENIEINVRNVLTVYVSTDNDSVFVNGKKVLIEDLSGIAQNYILGDIDVLPKLDQEQINIELIGECYRTQLLIVLRNERAASYQTYINVQNQLVNAYNVVRDKKAMEYFGKEYGLLNERQQKAIKELVPQRISEAEPEY